MWNVVETPEWAPQDQVRRAQRRSQALLLLHWGGEREAGIYTAKLFEYLAARRPILQLGGPRGVITRLLDETGAGLHVTTPEGLEAVLLGWWREIADEGRVRWRGDPESIARYSHRRMAREFAGLLDRVSARRSP